MNFTKEKNQYKLMIISIIVILSIFSVNLYWFKSEQKNNNKQISSIQSDYNKLVDNYNELKSNYKNLNKNYNSLQGSYNDIQSNYSEIQKKYQNLKSNYDKLQSNYKELQDNYDELSISIIGMNNENKLTSTAGTNYYNGHKESYYNLPMEQVVYNAKNNGIEGNYWIRKDGAKMLGVYVMVAADQSIYPYGSIVETSLGQGIVVDTGGFIVANSNQFDIATNW